MDNVGENIKKIRTITGITQADLANALGTTTAAISRYESGKRELRFAQAQVIADVLGVSVFELYGLPSERRIQIENSRKMLSRIREQIQHNSEGIPDETTLRVNESLQLVADEIEKELQDEIKLADISHKAQTQASLIAQLSETEVSSAAPQADPISKRRNKRLDSLISTFSKYPDDTQKRILDIVTAFGQLNEVGQKHAVGRIKELTELPRYQAAQETDTEI